MYCVVISYTWLIWMHNMLFTLFHLFVHLSVTKICVLFLRRYFG